MTGDGEVPTFHIVVPYLDSSGHRERLRTTLSSITTQSAVSEGEAAVRITVAEGSNADELDDWLEETFPSVELVQQPDEGMYDALARVLRHSHADYFGWLGAGDTYEPAAFSIVLENAPVESGPFWITGLMRGRRLDGAVIRSFLPFRYRKRFFETGLHGTVLPTIQQESTFWNSWLHSHIDFDELAQFRLAGDFYLWQTFSRFSEPLIVEAALGSFSWHGDNQSQDYESYLREMQSVTRSPKKWERAAAKLERAAWALHPAVKARIGRGHIRRFSWPEGPWTA